MNVNISIWLVKIIIFLFFYFFLINHGINIENFKFNILFELVIDKKSFNDVLFNCSGNRY